MKTCSHQNLVLLPEPQKRLRCRRCHLSISAAELGDGPCPERLERSGDRRFDFEPVASAAAPVIYRCEACGALIGK